MDWVKKQNINSLVIVVSIFSLLLFGNFIFQSCTSAATSISIASSEPSDGSTKVSVLGSIKIVLSVSPDVTTINATNITLKKTTPTNNISCNITYDDNTKTITLLPLKPLSHSTTYHCTLAGIKDTAGNEMASQTITFTTYINPLARYTFYSSGNVSYYTDYTYDANGSRTQEIKYTDAGVDGTWYTADDVVDSYTDYTNDANGYRTQRVIYNGEGVDSTWFTADDVVETYYTYTNDENGNQTQLVRYTGAGLDSTWFTADDVVGYYFTYTYDAKGNQTRYVYYSDVGGDGTLFTADDVVDYYHDYTNDENGNLTLNVRYSGYGVDSTWFTADDVVQEYYSYAYDESDKPTRQTNYNGEGVDITWFTADDVVNYYYPDSALKM